jgi:polyisoprenoid-binding protein YceI
MILVLSQFLQMAQAEPTNYGFTANTSTLFVKVYKADSLASDLAHDHAIQAVGWSGKATIDPSNISACDISISVPVNNLYVDKTEIRKLAGLEGEVSDSQRKEIQGNMLSEGQLNADKYPMITFKSTSCSGSASNLTLKGDFTLRGKTNSVSIPVKMNTDNGLSLKGSFPIKATEYGFQPYSAMFGAVANKDQMEIHFDIKGSPK